MIVFPCGCRIVLTGSRSFAYKILDWYDGVVTALAECTSCRGSYIVSCHLIEEKRRGYSIGLLPAEAVARANAMTLGGSPVSGDVFDRNLVELCQSCVPPYVRIQAAGDISATWESVAVSDRPAWKPAIHSIEELFGPGR